MNNSMLTTTRSPLDHILSGAIAGIISGTAISYAKFKNENADKNELIKQTVKFALQGGVISGGAIYCANCIAKKQYLPALLGAGLAVGAIIGTEQLIKDKK